MTDHASFEHSVFIYCPFDEQYEPILQAILFCLVFLGLKPRIASERLDGLDVRLLRIKELIEQSKYSIHDLSRCQAKEGGEYYRLNMPFELGVDYGCREFRGDGRESKLILVLEEEQYRIQAALSDLAGCDVQAHAGSYENAVRKVRNWLASDGALKPAAAGAIMSAYISFSEWHYERQLSMGYSEGDIQDYPTIELLAAMQEWVAAGGPNSWQPDANPAPP